VLVDGSQMLASFYKKLVLSSIFSHVILGLLAFFFDLFLLILLCYNFQGRNSLMGP
jgi:hypothetical protein